MKQLFLIYLLIAPIAFIAQQESKAKKEAAAERSETISLDDVTQPQQATYYKSEYINTRNRSMDKYSKEISKDEQAELNTILKNLEYYAPNSYEFHYTTYLNSNNDPNQFEHLQKAYEIYPNNVELYDDFIAYYELTDNDQGKKQFCEKLYKSNTVSQGVMDYNYNVLMSLEQNAILFTNGSDDTFPLWIWQEIKNTRKDVTVLNLDLIQNLDYQKNKLKELNIYPVSSKKPVDIVKEVAKNNPSRPINIGLTVNPKALIDLQDKLFLTGIVLKYSEEAFENINLIRNNWEYRFNKDFSTKKVTSTKERALNNNYILPLLVLSKEYSNKGETQKANEAEQIAKKVASEGGKEILVNDYLNK